MPAAAAALRAGLPALDSVEAGIRTVEADPTIDSVGVGGWPNLLGQVALDASIMDGRTVHTGAVAALQGFRHPISVARHVAAIGPGGRLTYWLWQDGMAAPEELSIRAETW